MSGRQQLVAFIGVALVLANLVTNRGGKTGSDKITAVLFNQGASSDELKAARGQLLALGAELVGVLILVVLTGAGEGIGNIALVFMIGLALVWAMTHLGGGGIGVGGRVGMRQAQ